MRDVKKPSIPRKLNPTERKLAQMFIEGVPISFLDSGMAYGYNYEYNRKHPVWEKPESHVSFMVYDDGSLETSLYLNTYRLLCNQLEYDKDADKKFQKWSKKWDIEDEDEGWEAHLDDFPEISKCDRTPEEWIIDNTYNGETLLDQHFAYYYCPNADYVILQIHGGCDLRCGYTNPVLFRIDCCNDFYPYSGGSIYCSKCHYWWDYNNCLDLQSTYGEENDTPDGFKDLKDYPCEKGEEGKKGIVVVNEKHEAFCPICGKGKLE